MNNQINSGFVCNCKKEEASIFHGGENCLNIRLLQYGRFCFVISEIYLILISFSLSLNVSLKIGSALTVPSTAADDMQTSIL